jgi:hypothetical protein
MNPDIRDDWRLRMIEEGFAIERFYLVSAFEALAAKMNNRPASENACEFADLDEYIKKRLPPERRSVKEQNLRGALANTIDALAASLEGKRRSLEALDDRLSKIETDIAAKSFEQIQRQVLDDPHVWVFALADVVGERAFGLIGFLFRVFHGLRMLPSRVGRSFSPSSLLRPSSSLGGTKVRDRFLRSLATSFSGEHAEASAYLTREGFAAEPFDQWRKAFVEEMDERLTSFLEPARRRLARTAKALTRWTLPVFELLWLVPFLATIGSPVYRYYAGLVRRAEVILPEAGFLSRSMAILGCIILAELFVYSILVRWSGRALHRHSMKNLQKGFASSRFGFGAARSEIGRALGKITELEEMRGG